MDPRLSIAVVVKNAESTLYRDVQRLVDFGAELFSDDERAVPFSILLVHSESTDDTVALAIELEREFSQVSVCRETTSNQMDLVRVAMRCTSGDYVLVCDTSIGPADLHQLWSHSSRDQFVMASVFQQQTIIRTAFGDETLESRSAIASGSEARLIARRRMMQDARFDDRHSEPSHLRPLGSHSWHSANAFSSI